MWVRRYNYSSSTYKYDVAYAITVDDSGNVYVTGTSDPGNGFNYDYATIKYDSLGDTVWIRRYNDPLNKDDGAYAIAVDKNSNVYVTGISVCLTYTDYATIKYNSSGDTMWVRTYSGIVKSHYEKKGLIHGGGGQQLQLMGMGMYMLQEVIGEGQIPILNMRQ